MWIDFERHHGLLIGMFFGRQSWLFGANGEGEVGSTIDGLLPHSRQRRYVAYLLDD